MGIRTQLFCLISLRLHRPAAPESRGALGVLLEVVGVSAAPNLPGSLFATTSKVFNVFDEAEEARPMVPRLIERFWTSRRGSD